MSQQTLKTIEGPSAILGLLLNMAQVEWVGTANLPRGRAIVLTGKALSRIAEAVLAQHGEIDSSGYAVVEVPTDDDEASSAIRRALEVGRREDMPVVPLGVAASPTTSVLGSAQLPLFGAHIVACVETPFTIPKQPDTISEDWIRAIQQQLRQANGRALDYLSTLRRLK